MSASLTGRQRRHLRTLGHDLAAVVQLGKAGVTDSLLTALDAALTTHELVKARISQGAPIERHAAAATLAERLASEVVQVLGNTVLLYRRHPEEPKIELP